MGYQTTPEVLTSQRIRRAAGQQQILKTHADADFSTKNVLTCNAVTAASQPIPGFVVNAGYFTAARFGNQAAAEAAFKANFIGVSGGQVEAGLEEDIVIFGECEVEYALDTPSVVRFDDYVSWVWNATTSAIEDQQFDAVGTVATDAIGRIAQDYGAANVGQVSAMVNRLHYP